LQWKRAAELFTRPQGPKEPVETYMAAILNLAKKAKSSDSKQILAAMINGFKPAIKLAVLQRPMETVQDVMESARIAEAANIELTPSADLTTLTKNVADLTTLVKELVKPEPVRAVTPPRQVRFDPSTTERRFDSPSPSSPPYQSSQQNTLRPEYQQQQQRQTYSQTIHHDNRHLDHYNNNHRVTVHNDHKHRTGRKKEITDRRRDSSIGIGTRVNNRTLFVNRSSSSNFDQTDRRRTRRAAVQIAARIVIGRATPRVAAGANSVITADVTTISHECVAVDRRHRSTASISDRLNSN